MSDVLIYHPVTGAQSAVPEESVPHHRRAGWLLLSEYQANEGAREEAEAKAQAKDEKGSR